MDIIKIEPEWHHGYSNAPSIKVTVDKRIDNDEFRYRAWSTDIPPVDVTDTNPQDNVMLISTNMYPWVKFVSIANSKGSPNTDGALSGHRMLENGYEHISRTGWSSRAGVINTRFRAAIPSEIVDVGIYEEGQRTGMAGWNIYADYLRNHPAWPVGLYLVRDDGRHLSNEVYHIISTSPDKVTKPELDPDKYDRYGRSFERSNARLSNWRVEDTTAT